MAFAIPGGGGVSEGSEKTILLFLPYLFPYFFGTLPLVSTFESLIEKFRNLVYRNWSIDQQMLCQEDV